MGPQAVRDSAAQALVREADRETTALAYNRPRGALWHDTSSELSNEPIEINAFKYLFDFVFSWRTQRKVSSKLGSKTEKSNSRRCELQP